MKTFRMLLILSIACLMLPGCAPKAEFDIRGEWAYTMTTTDGNTYDMGTITFSGEPARGIYLELNIYQVEYKGEYTVDGAALELTGEETWQGVMTDADTLNGTWSHDDGASGTFIATRR